MPTIEKSIEIGVPAQVAYNQWTQFEEFPRFMEGVEEVRQIDDNHLHWRAQFAGQEVEWDAEIIEQVPDRLVAWRSIGGMSVEGQVTFSPLSAERCRVDARIDYQPEGLLQKTGDALGFVSRRIEGNLERFKELLETQKVPTGAWRGEIHGGKVEGD